MATIATPTILIGSNFTIPIYIRVHDIGYRLGFQLGVCREFLT